MNEKKNHELVGEGLQRVSEAAAFLQVSRSQLYKLISEVSARRIT